MEHFKALTNHASVVRGNPLVGHRIKWDHFLHISLIPTSVRRETLGTKLQVGRINKRRVLQHVELNGDD